MLPLFLTIHVHVCGDIVCEMVAENWPQVQILSLLFRRVKENWNRFNKIKCRSSYFDSPKLCGLLCESGIPFAWVTNKSLPRVGEIGWLSENYIFVSGTWYRRYPNTFALTKRIKNGEALRKFSPILLLSFFQGAMIRTGKKIDLDIWSYFKNLSLLLPSFIIIFWIIIDSKFGRTFGNPFFSLKKKFFFLLFIKKTDSFIRIVLFVGNENCFTLVN